MILLLSDFCFYFNSPELFPSAPTSVSAIAVNTGSPAILIKWAPPEKNAEAVTGYKIMYRSVTNTTYKSVSVWTIDKFYEKLLTKDLNMMCNIFRMI